MDVLSLYIPSLYHHFTGPASEAPSSSMAALHSLFTTSFSRPSTTPSSSAYHRPTAIVSMAQNQSYWDSIHSDIESHLRKAIPIRHPVSVFEPMHRLTFAPPRTTASALCIAACELVGGNREDALAAASAIHLMHAAAYTHKNLPLTDKVGLNPKSETPHMYGPNIELLTGDGIMPFGFELLARSIDPAGNNSDKILRVIIEITRAVGAQGMVDSQDYEIKYEQPEGQPSGGLHGCGATCGAILGGGSKEEIEKLKDYGVFVGKIQAYMRRNEGANMKLVEKWRALALKELEYFDSRMVDQISSIL